MSEFLKGEDGGALVLVTIFLAALLGFASLVIDAGLLYLNRMRIQNAADAAALAGASQLPWDTSEAERLVSDYISRNGSAGDSVDVQLSSGNQQIRVRIDRLVAMNLSRVFGFGSENVSAVSSARAEAIGAYWGAVPFGVVEQDFEFGVEYLLKLGAGIEEGPHRGNFGPLSLGGTGASNYRRNIALGYRGWLRVGDMVDTEPGNMAQPTLIGIRDRFREDECETGCTYLNYEPDCTRLIVVPVIDSLDDPGRSGVLILGFAVFFLEDVGDSPPGQTYITGRFIERHVPGEGGGPNDYGALTTKLVLN